MFTARPRAHHPFYASLLLAMLVLVGVTSVSQAAVSISALGVPVTEDFNTLATSGTGHTSLPSGWALNEAGGGGNADGTYRAGDGGDTTGDTYSFGTGTDAERALGELSSGSVQATFGAEFSNDTGVPINELAVAYTGEQWRNSSATSDVLSFEYSLDATSLTTGTWTAVTALDFVPPTSGSTTALDGNLGANQTALSSTITGLSIAPGSTVWIRWVGINAGSSDDGLAVDDFSITAASLPSLSIDDVSLSEGDAGTSAFTFTVSLSATAAADVTVDYFTTSGTATVANNDYIAASGTATITAGNSSTTLTVDVVGDVTLEGDETFEVNLANPSANAVIGDGSGTGLILNDDAVPSLSIDDVTLAEGNTGTTAFDFTISLSNPTDVEVTVGYFTTSGTATLPNNDYVATSGTATIPAKSTSTTITVPVVGDLTLEGDETFDLNLIGPAGATLLDGVGLGTITNDDAIPSLSVDDVSLAEGNAGTTAFKFTVSLSNPTDVDVTVTFATSGGSATLFNNDYVSTSGTATIPAKSPSTTITVPVVGDVTEEASEVFFLNLLFATNATIADAQGQGQILNDDNVPTVSIDDVLAFEGNSGTTAFNFTVTLSNPTAVDVKVNYATADGPSGTPVDGATLVDNDYQQTSGIATIPAKSTSTTITVLVNGDVNVEPHEIFLVNLSNPQNASIGDGTGEGFIELDDGTTAVGDLTITEFTLGRVTPNPMRDVARIDFALPRESHIRLTVLDVQGRVVAVLAEGLYQAGRYEGIWNGRTSTNQAATGGVYFVRYQTPDRNIVKRIVVVR